jgi:chitodextrinase
MQTGRSKGWRTVLLALLVASASLYGCGASKTAQDSDPAGGARPAAPITQGGSTRDREPPSTPTGLSGSAVTPSQVSLSWSASTDAFGVTGYRVYRNGALLATLGNVTAHQDNGVSASATYSYTVQALDAAGNASAQSAAAIVTTTAVLDTIAPTPPTVLGATGVSVSRIDVSWSASVDNVAVTGYRVFRNGALLLTLGNVTSYADRFLSSGVTYVYAVQAFDAAGNVSGMSPTASATTSPDTTPPTVPANLLGNPVSPTQIDLSWSASTDNDAVANYRLYRDGVLAVTVTSTSFQDINLSLATTYAYRVEAVDVSGNVSGPSATILESTLSVADTSAPTTPVGLTASAASDSRIDLSWAPSADNVAVTGYRIFRNGLLLATVGNVTTYASTGLAASTTYSYAVRAFDAAGNVSGQSAAASATTFPVPDLTAPTIPAGLAATAISSSRIGLSWSASSDNVAVTGYRVYRNNVFLAALGNVTTYESAGLAPATTYTYHVDAVDAAGNASSTSAPASATTLGPDTATLAWDPVIHPNLGGYRLYYGIAPRTYLQPAGSGVSVGNSTSFTVTGLTRGTRYYFAVTAFDTSNNESVFSNEVFKDIP